MLKLLLRAVRWLAWLGFVLSPLGGVYYFVQTFLLNLVRLRSKTLQGNLDEIHYVRTPDDWRLALIRYSRNDKAPRRKYPVLLIHGLSSNRMAFDCGEPDYSLAPRLVELGFDVWIAEMRGSNLSFHPRFGQSSKVGQCTIHDYVKQDLPTMVDFVLKASGAKSVHCVGHSMGGILILSYLSQAPECLAKIRSGTLVGSSMMYGRTGSSYERVAPMYELAERFPTIAEAFLPHGLIAKLISNLMGYNLRYLPPLYSFQLVPSNMEPRVTRRVYQFGFHAIPLKLMLSLASAVRNPRGISDEQGTPYIERFCTLCEGRKGSMPALLLIGGERDEQCPAEAVQRTADRLREVLPDVRLALFGRSYGQQDNYGHFDLLLGKRVRTEVFPKLEAFLLEHDE